MVFWNLEKKNKNIFLIRKFLVGNFEILIHLFYENIQEQ